VQGILPLGVASLRPCVTPTVVWLKRGVIWAFHLRRTPYRPTSYLPLHYITWHSVL